MQNRNRENDLHILAQSVLSTIVVTRAPADTYITADELSVGRVLGKLGIPVPQEVEDGGDWPDEYVRYAEGLLDDLQEYLRDGMREKQVAALKDAIGFLDHYIDVDLGYQVLDLVAVKLGLGVDFGYETPEEQEKFLEGMKPSSAPFHYEPDPIPPTPGLAEMVNALEDTDVKIPETAKPDLCIWWIPRGDIYKVTENHPGGIPEYLLERMTGIRMKKGDLWIPPCINFQGKVKKDLEKVDTTVHAGFMFYRRDLAKVAKLPGFVTDLDLQVIDPPLVGKGGY